MPCHGGLEEMLTTVCTIYKPNKPLVSRSMPYGKARLALKFQSTAMSLSCSRIPSPAAHNNQPKRGEQVRNPQFTQLAGLKEKKVPYRIKALFIAVCTVTQCQKMFISPSAHTPLSRMMGRLKFEQTVKLEEHSYFWASPKIFCILAMCLQTNHYWASFGDKRNSYHIHSPDYCQKMELILLSPSCH